MNEIKTAVIQMDEKSTEKLVIEALEEKYNPLDILNNGLIPGMKAVGELFTRKEYFVPEILLASDAFYRGFNLLTPYLKKASYRKKDKVLICVVQGDIHDIGKNIVKVMIESAGFQVIDLGRDVPIDEIIKAVKTAKPQILALSSLMTTTMLQMGEIINRLEKENLRKNIKIIIGGAPLNQEFARKIKADGYGEDAAGAVDLIEKLIRE